MFAKGPQLCAYRLAKWETSSSGKPVKFPAEIGLRKSLLGATREPARFHVGLIVLFLYQIICHECYVVLHATRAESTPAQPRRRQRCKVTVPAACNCAIYRTQ
jgi:hypothetical protein